MITQTEIRVGNILQDVYGRPGSVLKFTRSSVQLKMEHSTLTVKTIKGGRGLDVRPVELTEEWLVNLGFEKTHSLLGGTVANFDWWDYRKGTMVINFNIKWDSVEVEYCSRRVEDRTLIGRFKYVHQLQNLYFALTGSELSQSDKTAPSLPSEQRNG